jgi:Flp pilus assembly protein TadG
MRPRRANAGVVGVEFALLSSFLVLMLTGTLSIGILTFTQAGLQSVSMLTARCVALGSPLCPAGKSYAVSLATARLFSGVISSSDVTITSSVSCAGATGHYTEVAISSSYWSGGMLGAPFSAITVTATSCYPNVPQ